MMALLACVAQRMGDKLNPGKTDLRYGLCLRLYEKDSLLFKAIKAQGSRVFVNVRKNIKQIFFLWEIQVY